MNRLFAFCGVCFLSLLLFSVNAQRIQERFEQLTTKDGLSHFTVLSILQDKEGFMWFGTGNGLNKYDGYTFTIYQSDPINPKRGLGHNGIRDLLETRSGDLWAATGAGLHHVNKGTGVITPYRVNTTSNDERDLVFSLIEDQKGQIWTSSRGGLNCFNPKSKKFTLYASPDSTNMVVDVVEDNTGKVWITTQKGLYQLNLPTKSFTLIPLPGVTAPLHIYKDGAGIFWINAEGSIDLYRFNPINQNLRHYPLRQQGMTGELINSSNAILEESADELWVGTRINQQTGLYRLHKESGRFVAYAINPNLNAGLNSSSVWSLGKDRSGIIWAGTMNGINKLVRKPARFQNLAVVSINPAIQLAANYITSVCEDARGTIWTGNYSNGLYRYDRATGRLLPFLIPFKKEPYQGVVALHADRSDTLWIAMREGDLYALLPDRRRFIRYAFKSGILYRTMTEDQQGRMWVIGHDRMGTLDRRTGQFTYYPYRPGEPFHPFVLSASRKGGIWIGTMANGIFWLDLKTKKITPYNLSTASPGKRLTDGSIRSLYEDPEGILWVGTAQGGLNRFDPKNGNLQAFTTKNGLPNNYIFSIQPDTRRNLWLTTDRGLCRLNTRTGQCRIYNESDGLPDANFTEGSARTRQGYLLFGTPSGLIRFHPDSLPDNRRIPPVYITRLKVLEKIRTLTKNSIELSHQENYLSFDFVALNYDSPEKNQYAYQLQGVDKSWVKSGNRRFTSYPNLSPGKYVFRVKASNNDGVWNQQGTSLTFIIHPPWWKTWWAYTLYAAVFITSIWGFIAYRSRNLRRENRLLEEKVTLRTAEVVAQKEELQSTLENLKATQTQLIQSEKMASLGELTAGIAHEIQNPLNFVTNFSEVNQELLSDLREEIATGNLAEAQAIWQDLIENEQKINQHGKRADAIVKGMLQHSRTSTGKKEPSDINALAEEYLRLAYYGLRAKDKDFNANLITDFDNSIGKVEVVPQELGRVLLNLYNNAFYATQQKKSQLNGQYQPEVRVSTRYQDAKVEIKVWDNGTGMPESVKKKIFQPFFTTKPTGQGTGLGLSLSYDIITKGHQGELGVHSQEEQFAEFTILLPV